MLAQKYEKTMQIMKNKRKDSISMKIACTYRMGYQGREGSKEK